MPYMLPVFERAFKDCGVGIGYDITMEEFNGRYYQATCNLQAYSARINPYHLFMTHLSKIESRHAMKFIRYLEKKPKNPVFVGLFPLHACLNHDCYHNVEVGDGGMEHIGLPGVMVVAKRNIKKGDELMTTYINPQMSRRLRRAWLFKSFNFWCRCRKCQFEGDDSSYCTECEKPAYSLKCYPACGKCKRAFYCSVKCQKSAWKRGHKEMCAKLDFEDCSLVFELDSKLRR